MKKPSTMALPVARYMELDSNKDAAFNLQNKRLWYYIEYGRPKSEVAADTD
jgi:hypothetical protein